MNKITFSMQEIDTFIFDFDGVLTNNLVYLDEMVKKVLVVVGQMDWLLIF